MKYLNTKVTIAITNIITPSVSHIGRASPPVLTPEGRINPINTIAITTINVSNYLPLFYFETELLLSVILTLNPS